MTGAEYFLERLREVVGKSAEAFAKRCGDGIKPRTLRNWLDGVGGPDPAQIIQIARVAGRPVGWFFGEAEARMPEGIVMVPVLDARAAAGSGAINGDHIVALDQFPFPERFIRRLGGVPGRVAAIRPEGDSMQPTIAPGALVLVDHSKTDLPTRKTLRRGDDDVYVFQIGPEGLRETRIKRLQRTDDDRIALISDNPQHRVEIARPDEITIVGRAIWWDNRL